MTEEESKQLIARLENQSMDMQNENERLMVFEHARKVAEATYVKNPLDAEVSLLIYRFLDNLP